MSGIGGLILAAGGSTRMGVPKQLLRLGGGSCLVQAAVRAAQEGGCESVCVVTGCVHEAVEDAVAGLNPQVVHNEHWQLGMGGSVRLGMAALAGVSAVVVLTCDQPAVSGAVVRALVARQAETQRAIVACRYADTLGVPALFAEACFAELLGLPDERGAKAVIQADAARVAVLDFPEGAFDLDTPGDVRNWLGDKGGAPDGKARGRVTGR